MVRLGLDTTRQSKHGVEGLADEADVLGAATGARVASKVSPANHGSCRRRQIDTRRRQGGFAVARSTAIGPQNPARDDTRRYRTSSSAQLSMSPNILSLAVLPALEN